MNNSENIMLTTIDDLDTYIANFHMKRIKENQPYPLSEHQPNNMHLQIQLSPNQYNKLLQTGYSGEQHNVYYTLRANNQVQISARTIVDLRKFLFELSN